MALDFSHILDQIKHAIPGIGKDGFVGIDVGSSSIKLVELHNQKKVPTLDTYGELQLGPYAEIEIGRTTNLEVATLAQALIDLLRESSVTTNNATLSISYNSSFATVITLPTLDPAEIAAKVSVEARKYIPVPLNTVSLDWFTVGYTPDQTSTKVLIVAIHNDSLKKYQSTVTSAGLETKLTEIEVFSMIRSVLPENKGAAAVLDLGASGTRLYIAERGMLTKAHSLRMGGTELTSLLAETLSIEFSEAEELKRSGLDDTPEGRKALNAALERSFREVGKVIHRYEQDEEAKIQQIFLTGGGSLFKNIDAFAQDILELPVKKSDPFAKVAYPAFLEDVLTQVGPSFSVAIGAALEPLVSQDT